MHGPVKLHVILTNSSGMQEDNMGYEHVFLRPQEEINKPYINPLR